MGNQLAMRNGRGAVAQLSMFESLKAVGGAGEKKPGMNIPARASICFVDVQSDSVVDERASYNGGTEVAARPQL
jgi:hypothetical protein